MYSLCGKWYRNIVKQTAYNILSWSNCYGDDNGDDDDNDDDDDMMMMVMMI